MDVITHSVVLLAVLTLLILGMTSLITRQVIRGRQQLREREFQRLLDRSAKTHWALKDAADTLAELIANRSVYGDSKDKVISTYNTVTTALAEEKK